MTDPASQFLDALLDQLGDKVKYGTEVAKDAADSTSWDASELVEWAANRSGATMPDGSWRQYAVLQQQGHGISAQDALHTPGALLFKFSSDPLKGIPAERQVMISLGDGRVIDASGSEVRIVEAKASEFTHAAEVPAFAVDPSAEVQLRDHLRERLGTGDEADPVPAADPPAPAPPAEEPPPIDAGGTPTFDPPSGDPVALRKQAMDLRQEADERRAQLERGETRKAELEADALRLRDGAQSKRTDARQARADAEASKLEAAGLEGDEAAAKVAESNRFVERAQQLETEAAGLQEQAEGLDISAERAQQGIDATRTEATRLQDESLDAWAKSTKAIEARMPELALDGRPVTEEVKLAEIPPPPPANATEGEVRAWVKQRELAESTREEAALQKQTDAAQLDDLAEVKRALAADAQTRAATLHSTAAAEQDRLVGLQERQTVAQGHADRLMKEMTEEQAVFERLTKLGDAEGVALSNSRLDELLSDEMSWSVQAHNLKTRMNEATATIATAQEDARDLDDIATTLREEAQRAAVLADEREAEAAKLQAEADRLDTATDAVEDALTRDVSTEVHIVGQEEIVVDVPGRETSDLSDDEFDELQRGLPGAAPAADEPTIDEPAVAPPGPASDSSAPDAGDLDLVESLAPLPDTAEAPVVAEFEPAPIELETAVASIDASADELSFETDDTLGDDSLA